MPLILGAWAVAAASGLAATLAIPAVDGYNIRVGTETFAGLYHFTTNTVLVETAEAITNMGSDVIKFYMGSDSAYQAGVTLPSNVTNLITEARDEPSYKQVLDMPFRHFIIWEYPFGNSDEWWGGGYNATQGAVDYTEMYQLTCYLLTNYNNSGKTFYLGHWEGDGYLSVTVNGTAWATNPSAATISGMIGWLNNRQKAVDDAKNATAHTNVFVYNYSECNRVRDAMLNGPTNNERVINDVIPYVTNLDYVSYSSYDAQNLSSSDLYTTLNYIQSHIPTNKAPVVQGERLWIGEYGWGYETPAAQEPVTRSYIQRLLGWNYGGQCLPFILFWEMYNNQTPSAGGTNYYLISPTDTKAPCYYLHQYFLNAAKLMVAQFNESTGALPTDTQYSALVSPMLNSPLAAPVNLTLTNANVSLLSETIASASASLAQGVYGDDDATVSVYWGRQNGGQNPASWESSMVVAINTNFNPTTYSVLLTNLLAGTNYYVSFFASNASAQVWAPAANPLSTAGLATTNYACRMRITFPGYNRAEALGNFPALMEFSNGLAGFSYSTFASATGGDLRFTDAGGLTVIPHEINQWNTAGTSTVWVRLPVLSGTNTCIWAYWGNPLAASPPAYTTNGSVWQPRHLLVWHLEQSYFPYTDSTGNYPARTGVAPEVTVGEAGWGGLFNGSTSYLHAGSVNAGTAFTLFAWVRPASGASNIQTIFANKPGGWNTDGFGLYVNTYNTADQRLLFEDGDGSNGQTLSSSAGVMKPGVWHSVAASVNETLGSAQLYVDGTNVAGGATVPDFANNSPLDFGRFTNNVYYFAGAMDEARIASGLCSSNWIWASWMNATSNGIFNSASAVNPSPVIGVTNSNNMTIVDWPQSAGVFVLYTSTDLSTGSWTPATNAVSYSGGQWQAAIVPSATGAQFFRLQAR